MADRKNVMNTHGGPGGTFLNVPSKPEIEESTAIRLISGAAAFGIGKIAGSMRIVDKNGKIVGGDEQLLGNRAEYDWEREGKAARQRWIEPGKTAEQTFNDPYKAEGEVVPDDQKSLWFSGVRVIDSLTMSYPSFTTDLGVNYPASQILIQNIMMDISQKKNVVRTRIAGSDGQVKQYISLDDYDVSFRGKIIGYDGGDGLGGGFVGGERPKDAISAFIEFMEAPTVVEIGNEFLELAKITRGVIGDFKLIQEVGKIDNQAFTFKLWSDKPFKIIIQDV